MANQNTTPDFEAQYFDWIERFEDVGDIEHSPLAMDMYLSARFPHNSTEQSMEIWQSWTSI